MLIITIMIEALSHQETNTGILTKIKNYVFRINHLIGNGNFSKVYAGTNQLTNQPVAVKVIQMNSIKNPKLLELHRNQLQVLLKINHPNCIRCLDVIKSENQCYIVTELCDGGDLDMYAKKRGFLSEDEVAPFLKDILEGLIYLASLNIVHRDLKVANVFIHKKQAKIADFGFAVINRQKFQDLNIGSPLYMSPEGYIYSMYGPKTDVWAFGVLIYELLHGDTPFSHCKLDSDLKKNLSFPFDRMKIKASVSPDLREVILRCLEIMEARRISVYQLRQMNYFKRIYQEINPIFTIQLKPNEPQISNFSRASVEKVKSIDNLYGEDIKRPFLGITARNSPAETHINQAQPTARIHHLHYLKPDVIRLGRPISTAKKEEQKISPIRIRERFGSIDSKKPMERYVIFNPSISFKTAINILHYCRCMYRYIQLLIQVSESERELKFISGWMLLVLEELKRKINENEIVFEGINKDVKAEKFREVRTDYQRRYSDNLKPYLGGFLNKPNLLEVRNFFFLQYRKYDFLLSKEKTPIYFQIGYFSVLLHDATRLLIKCQQQNDFLRYANYRDLEQTLQLAKQKFDALLFSTIRKRIVLNR